MIDESNNNEGESFYGYGWVVVEPMPGFQVVTHNGGNNVYFADMVMIPSLRIVAFIQTNVVSSFRPANELLEQMMMRMQGQPYPAVPDVAAMDASAMAKLAGSYTMDESNRIEVAVDGNALHVTPYGWSAYAAVHSVPEQDTADLVDMSAEIDRIVGGYIGGDFQPLHDAYGGKVTVERLEEMYAQRQAERVAEHGNFEGYEVLGTGTGAEYHFTPVWFNYERERIMRTYVWSRENEALLGVTTRHMEAGCRFFPVAGGGFESWEPSTGASVAAAFSGDGSGAAFVLKRDAGEVTARR